MSLGFNVTPAEHRGNKHDQSKEFNKQFNSMQSQIKQWEHRLVTGILVSEQLHVVVTLGPRNPGSLVLFAKVTTIPAAVHPNLGQLVLPVLAVASRDISRWNARTWLEAQLTPL